VARIAPSLKTAQPRFHFVSAAVVMSERFIAFVAAFVVVSTERRCAEQKFDLPF